MDNTNLLEKKKQYKLLAYVSIFIVFAIALFCYVQFSGKTETVRNNTSNKTPVVDGVISPTLTDSVTRSAITENNVKTSLLEDRLNKLEQELSRKDQAFIKLQQEQEVKTNELNAKIIQLSRQKGSSTINVGEYNLDYQNSPTNNQTRILRPKSINTISINSSLLLKTDNELPYIPSGSFAKAMIIEGADANASVTGGNSTVPMQFNLIGKIQMPNGEEYDATGCFVTAEVYGDISSERGEVRTRNISCKLNGKTIDMKFKGHVAYMGKNGIRGTAIMRNGKIIAWAGASGLLSGLGSGVQSVSTTVAGIGATTKPSANDVLSSALGGAFEKSASTLSEYYIKRAEQYHPIIEINANNEVTVMFQEGFQLSYIETEKSINSKDLIAKGRDSAINDGDKYLKTTDYNFGGTNSTFDFESLTGKKIVD